MQARATCAFSFVNRRRWNNLCSILFDQTKISCIFLFVWFWLRMKWNPTNLQGSTERMEHSTALFRAWKNFPHAQILCNFTGGKLYEPRNQEENLKMARLTNQWGIGAVYSNLNVRSQWKQFLNIQKEETESKEVRTPFVFIWEEKWMFSYFILT